MARLTHRRELRTSVVAGDGPLGWVERVPILVWTFAALGVIWMVTGLRPLLDPGFLDSNRQFDSVLAAVRILGGAALVALPAGLLVGFPGARRRSPWLFRGVVLLALAELSRPAFNLLENDVIRPLLDPTGPGLDPTGPVSVILSITMELLSVSGAWALSLGLAEAGARPRRGVLPVVVGASVGVAILQSVSYALFSGATLDLVMDLPRMAIALASVGAWFAVATRLVVGGGAGLVPRRAWILGGVAGALMLVNRAGYLAIGLAGMAGVIGDAGLNGSLWAVLLDVLGLAGSASSVLLLVGFALGLGRGHPLPSRGFRLGRRPEAPAASW